MTSDKISSSQVTKIIYELCNIKLIHHSEHAKCQGYTMGYGAYDYLAMNDLSKQGILLAVGNQLGVGKESDIFHVMTSTHGEAVMKLHRLGRTSFKKGIKQHREYYHFESINSKDRNQSNWLFKSKVAAKREYQFMKLLHENELPVPFPLAYSRHCVIMTLIEDGMPLYKAQELQDPSDILDQLIQCMIQLIQLGYVHGDLNEFNVIISHNENDKEIAYLIDFPQMISIHHPKAESLFMHDLKCIESFFLKFGAVIENSEKEELISMFNLRKSQKVIDNSSNSLDQ